MANPFRERAKANLSSKSKLKGHRAMTRTILTSTALVTCLAGASMAQDASDVLTTYSDIAHAKYEDSLITAQAMQAVINDLVENIGL